MLNRQLICAENIKLSFGEQSVLDFERYQVYEGDRIGLIGANGVGKTTLLRLLAGELEPDTGIVKMNCEPFYFKQFAADWDCFSMEAKEIKTLGVKEQIWQENVSGGENTRIRLAEMFSCDRPVAFLDEPSANLDMKGIDILKRKLLAMDTFVLVSHDRALLNEVCSQIVEISFGKVQKYEGNYDNYLVLKQAEYDRQLTEYEEYQAEKKRLQNIYREKKEKAKQVERKPRKISSSEAKARNKCARRKIEDKARGIEKSATNVLKRLEHMEVKEKPRETAKIRPDFRLTNPPKNPIIIHGEHITYGYDENLLYEDASFVIKNQSKVALLGDNGVGKTTLINMIFEQKQISVVPGAKLGYLRQNLSDLDTEKTVLENVQEVSIQRQDITRMILARLLLAEQDMSKKVCELSGGERMKLAFARLFVSDANVLVLDEPTNYMDLPSIEALEVLLQEYEGTLVFVSHDMEFVRVVATDILRIKDRKLVAEEITKD